MPTWQTHFALMSHYNQRMNRQVYAACAQLSSEQLTQDRGAFFKSVLGSLNHILVADLIWLNRFADHRESFPNLGRLADYPQPVALNQILFDDLAALQRIREEVDAIICRWMSEDLRAEDFESNLRYRNMKGVSSGRNFAEVLSHFFNHQTHHRGQVTTLLSQLGQDVGVTDFLIDIPDGTAS